ncbi:hypothetical protein Pmar_PMAR003890 [Perkinsus marinus ATCC 50983]|uniref:Uncharacterized protein n=1 Tax=Perkinsus marinus (strain ATCC 50983 / TXsc) TaxID=423536 RepID=C5LKX2_PERM5|nr:hypothetical protein Pmar_PMAR003890 [Perkinsus marinus ATCC 50983]EER02621.1 hypothetical protein Pmar_PMAR003890 [Perkinsus marinus ATCC 50983]|eukprot:XP_002769903.1 hypothetical protein Pmar_PMAR003890 [Perkinsus marinus ATCC 50983]
MLRFMLRVVGGVLMIVLSIAAAIIPDEVRVSPSAQKVQFDEDQPIEDGIAWREMIRTPHFWLLVIAFSANTQAITFVASTFKMMGTSLCGMTDAQLVKTWSVAAVVNAVGRVTTGTFVVMPLATASLFGRANFQKNYGVVFMSFGLSALVAAWALSSDHSTLFDFDAVACSTVGRHRADPGCYSGHSMATIQAAGSLEENR